jgi:hypothetical protein
MTTKVEIKFSNIDEVGDERTLTYTQNNILCTEDLEYAFVKAAIAWGFDDYFFGYPPHSVFKEKESE